MKCYIYGIEWIISIKLCYDSYYLTENLYDCTQFPVPRSNRLQFDIVKQVTRKSPLFANSDAFNLTMKIFDYS